MSSFTKATIALVVLILCETSAFANECVLGQFQASCSVGIYCADAYGISTDPRFDLKQSCNAAGGTLSSAPCTQNNLVGSCKEPAQEHGGYQMVFRYYSPDMTTEFVKATCRAEKGQVFCSP